MIAVLHFVLVILYVAACGLLIFAVLLQQGKGAGLGASLGGGSSQTLFGSQTSNFMTRATGVMAALYMVLALVLGIWPPFGNDSSSDVRDILTPVEIEEEAPAPESDVAPAVLPTDEDRAPDAAAIPAAEDTTSFAPASITEAASEAPAPELTPAEKTAEADAPADS